MTFICEDVLSIIFSYANYHDFHEFYLVNSTWRNTLRNYTDYGKLLYYFKTVHFSFNKVQNLLYMLCKEKENSLVKWILSEYIFDTKVYSEIFKESCLNENLHLAEYIYSLETIDKRSIISIFEEICCKKNLEIVKWYYLLTNIEKIRSNNSTFQFKFVCGNLIVYQKFRNVEDLNDSILNTLNYQEVYYINRDIYLDTGIYHPDRDANKKLLIFTDANSYFIECCSKGLFDMVRELYLTNKVIIHYVYKKAFQISCMNGHVNIVEFLYSVGSYTHYYNYYEEVLNFHYDVFIDVCKKGKLEIAKILDTRKLLVTFNNFDEFFHICCINGHLEFAKWIYSRFRINIHWRNNIVFLSACENGHNSIVEWLLTIIDLDSNSLHRAFTLACKEGHLNTVKLLYSFKNVSFQFNNYEAINNCCYFGHLLILKWIFELKIDFNKIYKIVLDKCCFYNQYNVISWLYQLNKESFLIEIQDNIYYACMTNDVSLIKFLIKFIDKNKIVPICTKFKSYDILDLFD